MSNRKRKYKDKYVRAFMCGKYASLHVKVSDYLRIWYVATYGTPVILGKNHPARSVLEESIVSTSRTNYNASTVMSDNLWKDAIKAKAVNEDEWLEIVLPEYVVRDGQPVMVDTSWEIYDADIRSFKDELSNIFWNDVVEYVNDKRLDAQNAGKPFRADWTLEMFCAEHGITVEYFEQFRRAYYRYKKECRDEEKESRERVLQQRNENLSNIGKGVRFQMLRFLDAE